MRRPVALRERIHERLRQAILTGEFPPGTPLIEGELAARLGASRTPVREALRRLEAEGLLEPRGARGTVVRELRREDVVCIMEIREALEPLAARRAARRITAPQLRRLGTLLERMQAAADEPNEMERADTAFHDVILEAADGERLKRMLGDVRGELIAWRFLSLSNADRRRETVAEHAAILAALAARDEDAAALRTAEHVARVRSAALAAIAPDGAPAGESP